MGDIAITNTLVADHNVIQDLTYNAADEAVNDTAQDFVYTPTGRDEKQAFLIEVADSHGTVTFSIAGGVGTFGAPALTFSVAQNTKRILQVETGKYMQADGTIVITANPATGKDLTNDHALTIAAVELA